MNELPRITPEDVGISSKTLIRLIESLNELDTLNSIMIMRDGKVCLEGWWTPYTPELPHMLFSLSKSFVSAAIGIGIGEGRFSASDKLIAFFPEYNSSVIDEKVRKITLHHLLSMTSGHAKCAMESMLKDKDNDYIRGFLSSHLTYAPGTHFAYNSAATYMLSALIKKITGQNVREYLMPRLFYPLGIVPGIWESCPQSINFGGWGLYLTTEDIAKFANLLLNNGYHNGKQLIPADYLFEATRKQSDNSMNEAPDWKLGYGYQFWMSKYGFRADGASGQFALVIPDKKLAVAITSCLDNMQDILTIMWEELIPELNDKPLPEDSRAHQYLLSVLSGLSVNTTDGDLDRRNSNCFFEFEENSAGIQSCSVEFGDNECAMTFNTVRRIEQLCAGFGSHRINVFQLTDTMPHPTVASAAWKDKDILEIHTFCLDGTFRDIFRINFKESQQPLTRTSRCSTFRPIMPELLIKQ